MTQLLSAALGGAFGSVLRHLAGLALPSPFGTLAVNLIGGFLIGLAAVLVPVRLAPLLITGVLGGFTTFSAFSLDTLRLLEAGRVGQALAYAGVSVAGALAACGLGLRLARGLA